MKRQITILVFFMLAATAFADVGRDKYLRENRLLEEELRKARSPELYFVFNLKDGKTYIKSRGISLKEMPISAFSLWGSPLAAKTCRLKKKSVFIKPGRETIEPGEDKDSDNFRIEALEMADMPTRYKLVFDEGLRIFVIPEAKGFFGTLYNLLLAGKRYALRPLAMLWSTLLRKPYTALDIKLNDNDAQALYWSLAEGAGAIVYPP